MRAALIALPLLLAACGEKQAAQDGALIKAARAGMNAVRGLPGGGQATFTKVRLIGTDTVCGMIDGNDGDGPRPFATNGQMTFVASGKDSTMAATIDGMCKGGPVHEIASRNPQFSDLYVVE